jgi:putative nucleotidyltransferase with HDIG domain
MNNSFKGLVNLAKLSWIKEHRWLQDGLLLLFFVVSLTCFLYFKEAKVEHFELKTIAKHYVISQKGFEFGDTEATNLLKEESVRDLGRIYRISGKTIRAVEHKILKNLAENPQWRQVFPTVTFDELIHSSETVRDILLQLRFTDVRTIIKLKQIGQPYQDYITLGAKRDLTDEIWEQIAQKVFLKKDQMPATQFIFQQYIDHPWGLKEDFKRQTFLCQVIKDTIPLKMTKMAPGTRIIDAGEEIMARHVDMMQGMKKRLLQEQRLVTVFSLLPNVVLSAVLAFLGVVYLRVFYPEVLKSFPKKALIVTLVILTLAVGRLGEYLVLNKVGHLTEFCRYPLILPFLTMILAILIDRKVAIVISKLTVLMLVMILSSQEVSFVIINVVAALMTVVFIKTVRKRKDIFVIASKVCLAMIPLILAFDMVEDGIWSQGMAIDVVSTLIWMMVTAILVIGILPLLESVFGLITDMTLIESGDLSHPLLRRLNLEAPGTYRHSLAVSALAEEAAMAIGANPVFCRVAALFHDIGKLSQPQYFTENQFSLPNVHTLLTPLESAEVIVSHVSAGKKFAEEYELPPGIIDVILEHHGTGLVSYFYHQQIQLSFETGVLVEEQRFRYPGPLPSSRESAIIMLSDSVEAAFRSLDKIDKKEIFALVETVVGDKMCEHQLDMSHLTLEEVESIKKALVGTLFAASHSRVKYPAKEALMLWKSEQAFVSLN